jgi:hypothetical protein
MDGHISVYERVLFEREGVDLGKFLSWFMHFNQSFYVIMNNQFTITVDLFHSNIFEDDDVIDHSIHS